MKPTRREILAAAGGAVLLPGSALGFGETTLVDVAELDLGTTLSRPSAWKRLLYEVQNTTSVEVQGRAAQVKPEDPELFEHPFTVLLGNKGFDLEDDAVEQLSRYLAYGDSCSSTTSRARTAATSTRACGASRGGCSRPVSSPRSRGITACTGRSS